MIISFLLLLPLYLLCAQEDYKEINTKKEYTYLTPYKVKAKLKTIPSGMKPQNIILLIGDGMGLAEYYVGLTANRGALHINNMKSIGFSKTSSSDNYVTDSAAGGTALATGKKTKNGVIGCDSLGHKCESILELAEKDGKATGLVSTSAITHATPASFIAHQSDRGMYEAIAADFLATEVDVFIGGGYKFFSQREDKRNLIEELQDKGYTIGRSLEEVKKVKKGNVAVLTAEEHNEAYIKRGDLLPQATKKSISILTKNSDKGFFLMVEGSQIDWAGHQNDITYLVQEMLDFDRAVGEALKFAEKDGNTLVIVTADHETGGLTLVGGDEAEGYVKVEFQTGWHTGVPVPVFAYGCGAEEFMGIYENTEIFHKMAHLWGY